MLEQLHEVGLQANINKSEFYVKQTKYFSFIISTNSIKADLEKILVI